MDYNSAVCSNQLPWSVVNGCKKTGHYFSFTSRFLKILLRLEVELQWHNLEITCIKE